jgi:hypothetical protein
LTCPFYFYLSQKPEQIGLSTRFCRHKIKKFIGSISSKKIAAKKLQQRFCALQHKPELELG